MNLESFQSKCLDKTVLPHRYNLHNTMYFEHLSISKCVIIPYHTQRLHPISSEINSFGIKADAALSRFKRR